MEIKQKLPKKFKEKWVAALRSGKYNQSQGELYDSFVDGFCCLGVAANICGISKRKLNGEQLVLNNSSFIENIIKTKKFPKLLMGSSNPRSLQYNKIVEKLTKFNDGGKSFKWIASYIERYL